MMMSTAGDLKVGMQGVTQYSDAHRYWGHGPNLGTCQCAKLCMCVGFGWLTAPSKPLLNQYRQLL